MVSFLYTHVKKKLLPNLSFVLFCHTCLKGCLSSFLFKFCLFTCRARCLHSKYNICSSSFMFVYVESFEKSYNQVNYLTSCTDGELLCFHVG